MILMRFKWRFSIALRSVFLWIKSLVLTLEHIAITSENLEAAVGGKHLLFVTHNILIGLGNIYLEVIAVDPLVGIVPRCGGFDLDWNEADG